MAVMKNQKTGMWEVRTYYKDWTYFGRRKLNEIRPADVIQWQNEIMKLKSNKTFL